MADAEDIQPLVCDNGTGMVKVRGLFIVIVYHSHGKLFVNVGSSIVHFNRLVLLEMMLLGLFFLVLLAGLVILV